MKDGRGSSSSAGVVCRGMDGHSGGIFSSPKTNIEKFSNGFTELRKQEVSGGDLEPGVHRGYP